MRRATTPTHTFTLPEEVKVKNLSKVLLSYSQCGKKILEKELGDLDANTIENTLSFKLTQNETKLFTPGKALVQLRCKTTSDSVLGSQIIWVTIKPALNSEEL